MTGRRMDLGGVPQADWESKRLREPERQDQMAFDRLNAAGVIMQVTQGGGASQPRKLMGSKL